MANGNTIIEIKELLKQPGALKVNTAVRLQLEIQSQMYDMLKSVEAKYECLNDRVEEIEDSFMKIEGKLHSEIETVQRASIVLWVEAHPKAALAILAIYIGITSLIDIRQIAAWVMGLDLSKLVVK